jgi:hypothetical protein
VLAGLYGVVAVGALTVGLVQGSTVLDELDRAGPETLRDPGVLGAPALTAGRAIALGGSAGVAVALLGLLRRVDLVSRVGEDAR